MREKLSIPSLSWEDVVQRAADYNRAQNLIDAETLAVEKVIADLRNELVERLAPHQAAMTAAKIDILSYCLSHRTDFEKPRSKKIISAGILLGTLGWRSQGGDLDVPRREADKQVVVGNIIAQDLTDELLTEVTTWKINTKAVKDFMTDQNLDAFCGITMTPKHDEPFYEPARTPDPAK